VSQFSKKLIFWYLQNKRDLPWRTTTEPYRIWLSEIILQQTRVEQGMPYYFRFLEAFPNVNDLANASEDEVLKLWQGLGYYSRARNLHATAKKVAFELSSDFPSSYKDLKNLKGVGDYTASAIASICFNEAAAVVDGNVFRVLSRIFDIETPIDSTPGKKEFKVLAQELIDKENPATFNQALMEFGAIQCKPKNPYCLHCPFNDSCVALQKNKIASLPVKKGKTKIRNRYFNYLMFISEEGEIILKQRDTKDIWGGLYEFPLYETKDDVLIERDFLKKIKDLSLRDGEHPIFIEGLKIKSFHLNNIEPIIHKLSHQKLHVRFWTLNVETLKGLQAVAIQDMDNYAIPRVIDRFLETYDFSN
tara:strand:- start:4569 stop:5651 length:1083 start_codon:yes stop_codon:yes gene_type:complete